MQIIDYIIYHTNKMKDKTDNNFDNCTENL